MLSVLTLVLIIIIVNPKLGTFIIWPVLFTYPHGWWISRGFLPWNIGADDLFCIVLFFVVLVRRNMFGRVPVRWGYGFWVITTFVLVAGIATLAGSWNEPEFVRPVYLKEALKFLIYWGLFYSVIHCIDNRRDILWQFGMFALAAAIGGVVIILHYFFPHQMTAYVPPETLYERGLGYEARAYGAFLNPNSAACVMACSVMILAAAVRLPVKVLYSAAMYVSICILLIALLLTKSRAGLMALVVPILGMALIGKAKRTAWLIIGAGIVVAVAFAGVRAILAERVSLVYDPDAGWGRNVASRFETWQSYLTESSASDYLFGQGFQKGIAEYGVESHSAYVSLLTVYGVGGVIWAIGTTVGFLRRRWAAREFRDPFMRAVVVGLSWALLTWGVYGIAADAISAHYPRYLLLYLVVLIDRTSEIARHSHTAYAGHAVRQPYPVTPEPGAVVL